MRQGRLMAATAMTISLLTGGTIAAGPVSATAETVRAPSGQARVTKELRELEATIKGHIGAFAIDTATGKTVGYRSGQRFPLLSTFKAMACAAVLHKARTSAPGLMDKVVTWTQAEVKENSPVTKDHVKDGLTVAQLCEAAITVSDNTAGNMVLKQIGGPAGLTRYFRTLKDPVSRLDRWETELNDWTPKERRDTTTPAFLGRDLRAVTVGDALGAKDRERLIGWMLASQTGGSRIRAGLPKTWTVGDKSGSNLTAGLANDVAVVWPAKSAAPIIMAVYTTRTTSDTAASEKAIAGTATILARGLGRL
ncbi:class A beta-lactamase [Nonomuraea sp. NPDC002799]